MQQLISLFTSYTGKPNPTLEALPTSGSNRRYFRLKKDDLSLIGVHGESREENRAFIALSRHFHQQQLNTPEIFAVSEDEMFYIQRDLGDEILFDTIKGGRLTGVFSHEERALLHKTIAMLADFQVKGAEKLDFNVCYPLAEFNHRSVYWDLNYFKYNFLKTTGMDFQEDLLENDFEKLAENLLQDQSETFMYRDFQSRNVMLVDGNPYFIDFQGGRKGPVYYDVASFLWQAKANFPEELRNELIHTYIESLKKYQHVDESGFLKQLRQFVLFRTLQVLGAYGFRGYFEKKPHFIQSVPFALNNLRDLLKESFEEYPYLSGILREMTELKQFADTQKRELKVRIYSFAYKKGIPDDSSGNGGGYVFDCRAINNPGKYERYNNVTGLDEPVIQFLEEDGEMPEFLDCIYPLVDRHVKRYMERGFTDLMISFGCTGGQHRSVYAAQKTAEHISKKFGIKVSLVHREQNLEQEFRKR
ncbi:Phosphotransferase enzyme family protein [Porphyromonadaceae bacterium NLAE-zl-C104]|uniref:RapZ C-terminal domain-containing protein n=1 Tax=Proteiniphilum TaxID=294702 RepID=UPI0008F353ED|nr:MULTISPECIES: RNase adapter RapZ [Proteiniphilum]MDY9917595.1 RNase adapter RapZ [Proteiniphilum sp.]SFS32731.1 Phosphotransferase enzyme family protein [Porphyromonadaceae bacterium NLAE-zl-C104]